VNRALLELLWRSSRGGLVRRARRLRQPRYLIAFLASAAYFGFLVLPGFLRWTRQAGGPSGLGDGGAYGPAGIAGGASGDAAQLVLLWMALLLALGMTLLWALASSKPALGLSEADANLLLPAPLPRRKIIELAIWKQQAGLLSGALVVTLVRGYGTPATRLARLLTSWALLTLISLHGKGVSLWKARLRELAPAAARRRAGIAIALAAAYWLAVGLALNAALAGPGAGAPPGAAAARAATAVASAASPASAGLAAVRDALHRLAASPPPLLTALLAPFRWLAAAALGVGWRMGGAPPAGALSGGGLAGGGPRSGGGPGGLLAALFLAALLVAHYEWVVRSRGRFEDAVLERARRQLDRRRRRPALPPPASRARRREPFPLAPAGPPEIAIYWKNLLIPGRRPLARRAWLIVLAGVAAWAVGAASGSPAAYLAAAAGSGLMLMVTVPLFAGLNLRHDLRMDLLHVELLRSWPVPGWRLVAAELLAPATTALSWTLGGYAVLVGAVLAAGARLHAVSQALGWSGPGAPAGGAGGGMVGAIVALATALLIAGIPISLLSSAVQNLAALMFPGWIALGPERRSGSGLTGQRLLIFLGQMVALLVGLLPAALLVAAALLAGGWLGIPQRPWQAPFLALLASLPLLAEVAVLVRAGGAFWDRLDPAQELLSPDD
jgi:ABC-2 type transport system permease protein